MSRSKVGSQTRVRTHLAEPSTPIRLINRRPDPEAPVADADILVDVVRRTYRFRRYPSLCSVHNDSWAGLRSWLLWVLALAVGAFFVAGWAQMSFYFPCTSGYTSVAFKGADYCVNDGDLSLVVREVQARPSLEASLFSPTSPLRLLQTITTCPAAVCTKRIPVTMQTYAVLLNGALLGRWGAVRCERSVEGGVRRRVLHSDRGRDAGVNGLLRLHGRHWCAL